MPGLHGGTCRGGAKPGPGNGRGGYVAEIVAGDLVREFTFTNDGTAPLVVTRVITSCSCLKASFPKRPVPPGGQGVIRITYEPHKSEPGVFNKVIQVYSNSVDAMSSPCRAIRSTPRRARLRPTK